MESMSPSAIEAHWSSGAAPNLGETILSALQRAGKDLDALVPADLAPVDEFHVSGREATQTLAALAGIQPHWNVLDVGSGLGGSARHLATEYGCHVSGVDLTKAYCDTATMLSQRLRLSDRTQFHHGSALQLPFEAARFDLAWTEHAQMNIADKQRFYSELARVLKPGGRLAFHDILQGEGGEIHFPVPWAVDSSLNHLISPEATQELLYSLGFRILHWQDVTEKGFQAFHRIMEHVKVSGAPVLGTHFLHGDARVKLQSQIDNLRERRIAVIQAVLTLRAA